MRSPDCKTTRTGGALERIEPVRIGFDRKQIEEKEEL